MNGNQETRSNGETTPTQTQWNRGNDQSAAPASGEAVPQRDFGTPYLPEQASSEAMARWQLIQGSFVDDPRQSVADAHELVSELMERIVSAFSSQRDTLERHWSTGQEVSTEELRICLQNYRAFFGRLLPAMPTDDNHG